jgi:hypothetical protein
VLLAPFVYAGVFGVVGPPFGSLAVSLPNATADSPWVVVGIAAFALLSYLFGLVPAVATGICAGFAHRLPAIVFVPLCAVLGAGISLGFAELIQFGGEAGHSVEYMAVPGALGAGVAALFAVPIGRWLRRAGAI